jgi:hypothetical protein
MTKRLAQQVIDYKCFAAGKRYGRRFASFCNQKAYVFAKSTEIL